MKPKPEKPNEGQESVWDFPRPPALQRVFKTLRVVHFGETIAETTNGYRILETSHPPVYYIPPSDCRIEWLKLGSGSSFCEWKGRATYFDLAIPGQTKVSQVAWQYPSPVKAFSAIAGYIAFYCRKVDACYVDDEQAIPQPGGFYGGWITSNLAGPFKGVSGSMGW